MTFARHRRRGTLPRVSMTPIEPAPLPDPAEAVIPATRQPSQVTVSQPQPLTGPEGAPGWQTGAPERDGRSGS